MFWFIIATSLSFSGVSLAVDVFELMEKAEYDRLDSLLISDPDLAQALNSSGSSLLHKASENGNIKLIQTLVSIGADINHLNQRGYSPIFYAVHFKQASSVKILADLGADLNLLQGGAYTPLWWAAYNGSLDICKSLIKGGADIEKQSATGLPMVAAAFNGNDDIVNLFLTKGANPDNQVENSGWTPLHGAIIMGHSSTIKLLFENGADPDIKDVEGYSPLLRLINDGNANVQECADLLLQQRIDLEAQSLSGETALILASKKGYTGIVRNLLSNEADLDARDVNGKNSLHYAALYGYSDIAETLLAGGLNKKMKDGFGKTPIDYAKRYGHESTFRVLTNKFLKAERKDGLNRKLKKNEVQVFYLANRGWAARIKNHLLIFDQEDFSRQPDEPSLLNGRISVDELEGKNIIGIYTAFHGNDDMPSQLQQLDGKIENMRYVHNKFNPFRAVRNSFYMEGRMEEVTDCFRVTSIPMDEYTLGYLIEIDGLTIFFSGYKGDNESFKKEVDYLKTKVHDVDIAFLPSNISPELHESTYYFVENLNPQYVIPIANVTGYEDLYFEMKNILEGYNYRGKVLCARNPGDRFVMKVK